MESNSESGYSWLFFYSTRPWLRSVITGLVVIGAGAGVYLWYGRFGDDPSPDSTLGLIYATVGTVLMVMAAVGFTLRRRSRKRVVGQLNGTLNWHVCFAFMSVILLFMHSFGNFNPRSGTYALYGMIALVISGFIGRALDRLMPRLIAEEVRKALTEEGEDRIETISHQLQDIMVHNTQGVRGFNVQGSSGAVSVAELRRNKPLQTSWDLAYISLEETPQEVQRDASQYRLVPDRKSSLTRPGALIPGAQEKISALKGAQQAMQREQFYRYVIRYWRVFHMGLALVTVGLVAWHIMFGLQLLLPTWLHMM
jgi:hypothetical protein